MRMLLSLVLALAMLAAGPAADAATPSAPAFRTVKLSHYYPWTDGFGVTIIPDEAICRAKYGDQWKVKCAASLGAPGESVEGVTLTPPLKGRWMWESTTRMAFSPDPETPPTPGTTYTVDISGMPCPASVVPDSADPTPTPAFCSIFTNHLPLVDKSFSVKPLTFVFPAAIMEELSFLLARFHMTWLIP